MSLWYDAEKEDIDFSDDGRKIYIYAGCDHNGSRYVEVELRVLKEAIVNHESRQRFHVGDKVTYEAHFKSERGIVKSICDEEHVFVVYHCNDDWDNYKDYTGARTNVSSLMPGWK